MSVRLALEVVWVVAAFGLHDGLRQSGCAFGAAVFQEDCVSEEFLVDAAESCGGAGGVMSLRPMASTTAYGSEEGASR